METKPGSRKRVRARIGEGKCNRARQIDSEKVKENDGEDVEESPPRLQLSGG